MINKILYYLVCSIIGCLIFALGVPIGYVIVTDWQEAIIGFAVGFVLVSAFHFLVNTAIKLKNKL